MRIVIPVALQNLISAAVVSADILMIGYADQTAMSAVSLAGQVTFVLTLFYYGLSTGLSILTAQYWGKKDFKAIQRVLSIASRFSVFISLIFFVLSIGFPELLMRIYTNDIEIIAYGKIYLRPVAASFLAMSISQMYLSMLKSIENTKLSACISSTSLIVNIVLDALCVFVLFKGRPEMAVIGVAIATVIARLIEVTWCIVHSVTKGHIRFNLPVRDTMQEQLKKDFFKYTLPVQANFIVWGGALTLTATIIGRINPDMVAANATASVIRNLAVVFCGGIATGGSVLIGKYLGQQNIDTAKRAGNRISQYALIFGIFAGLTVLLLKPIVFQLVNLTDTAIYYLNGMLNVSAIYCIGKSLNSTIIGGVFPAGGDSKFGFLCDTIVMWGIVLPLGFLSIYVWQLPPLWIYIIINLDELIKLPAALIRYKQYKWLKNITRDFD
ncbi:MAG: MATE family efflux transporter [Anaerolineaceae bacterium]|nr:MAG: MATE family efflux transporter [Anaerolineaceae bacterium]